ncbi:MAG: hypothetical protein ACLQFW_00225 [Xanthobacteraceae bacterium]
MIRESGNRFSEKIMLHQKVRRPADSIRNDGVPTLKMAVQAHKMGHKTGPNIKARTARQEPPPEPPHCVARQLAGSFGRFDRPLA